MKEGLFSVEAAPGFLTAMVSRYEANREAIAQRLFGGKDPGGVVRAVNVPGAGGREGGVVLMELERGRLYYKTRDCTCVELLGKINELLFERSMTPEQVAGQGFAFQGEASRRMPAIGAERAEYFEWLGKLTAVFYALGSVNMHGENVVAAGETPVVVDADALLEDFRRWEVPNTYEARLKMLSREAQSQPQFFSADTSDNLETGTARRAAAYLLVIARGNTSAIAEAGRLLAWMVRRKRDQGCYTVFQKERRQYFLPAFLRGSTGVAYIMLRYAELMSGHRPSL